MPSDDLLLLVLNDMMASSRIRRELKFEGYSDDDVYSCLIYAIEKGLVEGEVFRPVSGKPTPLPQRLSAYGQDFIEQLQSKKREAFAVNAVAKPFADKTNNINNWHEMPLGKIVIGVATAIIAACIVYLLYQHFGLKLN